MEHFQWLTEEQSSALPPEKLQQVREEIGDVLIYLTRLADKLGIDTWTQHSEARVNRVKYPADKVQGLPKSIPSCKSSDCTCSANKSSSFFRSRPFDCLFFHKSKIQR